MTRQESFKRRVRERMAKTGERYGAARRVLIERSAPPARVRAAEPETSDQAVRAATGRGWDEWADLLDAFPGRHDGHGALVEHLREAHGVAGWWAQSVAVGYERISGIRLPHQRPDGTFTAGKSRTVRVDADTLRAALLDDADRADLFPGLETELRSKPTSKTLRVAVGPGVAQIAVEPRPDGRVTISVAHERLPDAGDVERWKAYWDEWLTAVDVVGPGRKEASTSEGRGPDPRAPGTGVR